MKKLLIIPLLFLFTTCEKPERIWSNPNDPESERSVWTPTDLQIEQISVTQIKLNWNDNAEGEDGFKIDRKIDDGVWEIGYGEVKEDYVEWIDTSAVPHSINHYRLYAFARENNSEIIEKSINPSFPTPTNLQVIQISDVEIKLTWEDNSYGEDGYRIDRKVSDGSWDVGYGDVSSDIEEWNDNSSILNQVNHYRIYGYANGNQSEEEIVETTPIFSSPTNLYITPVSESEVILSWDEHVFDTVVGYKIEQSVNNGDFEEIDLVNNTTYNNTNISIDNVLGYRIKAFSDNNISEPSEVKKIKWVVSSYSLLWSGTHNNDVFSTVISPNNDFVASGDGDYGNQNTSLKVWDIKNKDVWIGDKKNTI